MTPRSDWKNVRSLIEKHTGPVLAAEPVTEGLNSEIAVVVHTSLGAIFVKGLRGDHRWVRTQQREAEINPYVRQVAPRLLWHVEADDWNLLGFERVQGRRADYSPGSPDLPKVVQVMRQLGEIPCPDLPLKVAQQRWSSYTDAPELFAGDHLLHTEWNPGNVVINNVAHLVDWAWPTRGAAWIDPACWVVWLVASGHSLQSAEDWAARMPAWHSASRDALDSFAWAQATMWKGIAQDGPESWAERVAGAARQWAEHRNTSTSSKGCLFMSAESPPKIHPYEGLTSPDGDQVEIDIEMVPLVLALWARELVTVACCQDIGESAAGLRDPARMIPSGHGGFVDYYWRYAWLKMPLRDGKKLLNVLLGTSFHDCVTIRWKPGSWRMHVPLVYSESNSIDMAEAAQLYFPRVQVAELADVLTNLPQ